MHTIFNLLVFAVVALIVIVGYVLYRHADLKVQAQNLASAVLADAKADATRIAKQISGKA